MSATDGKKVIVIKKVKKGHGGHHGGSWKVAYADFVTAMMAFFLVMWIVGMDQGVRDMVQGYFNNPVGFKRQFSGGGNPVSSGHSPSNLDLRRNPILSREVQRARFEEVGEEIRGKLVEAGLATEFEADVEIVITEEGLRIELMETGTEETFFDKSSATLKPLLQKVLEIVAPELEALPNDVVVEGHTDALPFPTPGYTNWDLSVDRANAARRSLQGSGLSEKRLVEVRGYAQRQLKVPDSPLDPRNRRISILLPFKEDPVVEFLPTSLIGGGVAGGAGAALPEAGGG